MMLTFLYLWAVLMLHYQLLSVWLIGYAVVKILITVSLIFQSPIRRYNQCFHQHLANHPTHSQGQLLQLLVTWLNINHIAQSLTASLDWVLVGGVEMFCLHTRVLTWRQFTIHWAVWSYCFFWYSGSKVPISVMTVLLILLFIEFPQLCYIKLT